MATSKITAIVIVVLLILCTLFFSGSWFLANKKLSLEMAKEKNRENILSFTSLFVSKVITANSVVSFEDRLKLENAVRSLNNKKIFDEWENLIAVKDQTHAQAELEKFLQVLIGAAAK